MYNMERSEFKLGTLLSCVVLLSNGKWPVTEAGRIVVFQVGTTDPNSHSMMLNRITEELALRQHAVMVVTSEAFAQHVHKGKGIELVTYPAAPFPLARAFGKSMRQTVALGNAVTPQLLIARVIHSFSACEMLEGNKSAYPVIQAFAPDILVHDVFSPCAHVVGAKLKVPVVGIVNSAVSEVLMNSWNRGSPWRHHFPNPIAYNAQMNLGAHHPLTFPQRVRNSMLYLMGQLIQTFGVDRSFLKLMKRHDVDLSGPGAYGRDSMLLVNANFAIEQPRPLPPHVKMVGPIMVQPTKSLPEEFEEFMAKSEQGVIVAATGTALTLEHDQLMEIGKALSRLPVRVLWKVSKKEIPDQAALDALGLADNIKVVPWLPQNDLLAHNKTLAFLNHCGINSLYETMWHGVPIACVPGFGDQKDNAARAAAQGAGIALPLVWKAKEEQVYAALMRLLTDPSFKVNAQKVSKRLSSHKRRGVQRTADWIEHAMETDGAAYLRPPVDELSFVVRHSLDVMLFWAVCGALLLFALWRYSARGSAQGVCRKSNFKTA